IAAKPGKNENEWSLRGSNAHGPGNGTEKTGCFGPGRKPYQKTAYYKKGEKGRDKLVNTEFQGLDGSLGSSLGKGQEKNHQPAQGCGINHLNHNVSLLLHIYGVIRGFHDIPSAEVRG